MNETESNIEKNIEELTQFLLINELCGINEPVQLPFNYSYLSFNKDKQKEKKHSYNVASYISPLFMTTNAEEYQGEEGQERELKECVENSNFSESLEILLSNVLELPKLRYQESEKLFQVQTENFADEASSHNASKKIDFETSSHVGKTSEKTGRSSNFPYAQSIAEQKTPQSGKKIIDLNESSYEEEMDIQINMSARSSRCIIDKKSGQNLSSDYLEKETENSRMMKKQKDPESHIVFLTESEKMAKQEKNFIQNYFQSAKNQIMDHCSLNCCEGMFGKEESKSKKMTTMNGIKNLQLKKDQPYGLKDN